jgi:hypothetical protein
MNHWDEIKRTYHHDVPITEAVHSYSEQYGKNSSNFLWKLIKNIFKKH